MTVREHFECSFVRFIIFSEILNLFHMKCFSLKCLLFTTALLLAGYHSNSQIISTVVGNGTAGYSGDGAAATLAQLSGTPGVAVDNSGNIFIADLGNNCIRKVNAAGIISTYAGNTVAGFSGDNGPATAAQINHPIGIRLDKHGNLYICDELNHRVRKVNTAGIITTIAGTGTGATSGDGGPATAAELLMPGGDSYRYQ